MGAACTDTGRQTGVTQFATTTAATNRSQLACAAIDNYLRLFLNPQASGIGVVLVDPAGLERVLAPIRQHQRHFAAFNGKRAGDAFCLCRQINVHTTQGDLMITSGDSDVIRGATFAGLHNGVVTRVLSFHITLRISSRRDDDRAISQIKLAIRSVHGSGSILLAVLRRGLCGVLSFLRVATARVPCQNRRWQQTQHHDKRHYTCQ